MAYLDKAGLQRYDAGIKQKISETFTEVQSIIAEEFDANNSYAIGDYVTYDGKLYKFTAAHSTGAFDGSDAVEVTVADELGEKVGFTDYATQSTAGVVKVSGIRGLAMREDGEIQVIRGTDAEIKAGTVLTHPIVPGSQHMSTFYGLARAAGDTTQSASSNAVGVYTDEAKAAIKSMLGIEDVGSCVQTITGTSVTITGQPNTRYVCGEVLSISITPPSVGTIDVIFTSGSTVAVLTLPNTVKMPEWWEGVEANYTYELVITDGVYAGVSSWPI